MRIEGRSTGMRTNGAGGSSRPRSTITFAGARQHLDNRAEDLAQVRPEWGHATNAICIVGRRERTRGLFLDRRAFLNSYDPTQDDADATVLTRTLSAVFPVCGGINLEYYFSHIDPTGYGCGTKLPHNITSLLGVMDGAASDLRTGLPWQMVEIHEPVRLLIVCEVAADVMMRVLERNPMMMQMVSKRLGATGGPRPAHAGDQVVPQRCATRLHAGSGSPSARRRVRSTGTAAGETFWSSWKSTRNDECPLL